MSIISLKILRVLRFDNADSRQQHWPPDKLQPIREELETWDFYLRDSYNWGPSITMVEQLVCFRERFPFKQYILSKPEKYGIKRRQFATPFAFTHKKCECTLHW